ncbi:3-oxoacyl-[acyl-carrier protein] reductase [Sphaeroforma arctica JP610]|uniref:3-oxoacyl-[acyl-carrier-protein] reductase n=1 Tax=Sphaeroforma arctica JP610 TaxID=667725 RepID=A0A0L0FFX4_9EUKA|nr:3-oxoacyl-[acyl-carrier protein] reductase [Sphaeroforma arctica JP610]KNC75677.1 3-oxoacyl-[acyl-carrier protein] reductase [Sphaeroforma arctica JP610]|eukprot:XP_014149579.1 3-oxoacyl-[acyl-carrier protein] reductase [Sphaeroforma arctica JP610]
MRIAADISTSEGAAKAIEEVATFGEIDFLVNNVGIFEVKDFEDITDDDWEKYFQVNIMSCVLLCRHYLPKMLARNSGRIIVLASESGFKPLGTMIHYSMTKGSLINLARGMAETTKGTKVTVNSVLPGLTATEGLTNYFESIAKKDNEPVDKVIRDYFQKEEPASLIQRLVTTKEVGPTTAFLHSPLAGAINGSSQRCEGGVYRST